MTWDVALTVNDPNSELTAANIAAIQAAFAELRTLTQRMGVAETYMVTQDAPVLDASGLIVGNVQIPIGDPKIRVQDFENGRWTQSRLCRTIFTDPPAIPPGP